MTTVGRAYAVEARHKQEEWFRQQQNSRWNKCMGTVPKSIDEYYGPQPKYDYTWKGISFRFIHPTGLFMFYKWS